MLGDIGVLETTITGNRYHTHVVQDLASTASSERETNRNASSLPRGFTTHQHHQYHSSRRPERSSQQYQELSSRPLKGIRRHRHSFSHQHPTRRLKCVEIPDHELENPGDRFTRQQLQEPVVNNQVADQSGNFVLPRFVVENFDDLPRQFASHHHLPDPAELLQTLQRLPAEFWAPPVTIAEQGVTGNFRPPVANNNGDFCLPAAFDFAADSKPALFDENLCSVLPPEEFRLPPSPQSSSGGTLRRSRFSSVRSHEGVTRKQRRSVGFANQEPILDGIPAQFLGPTVHFEDTSPLRSSSRDQHPSVESLPEFKFDVEPEGAFLGEPNHAHHHHRPHCHAENHAHYHSLKRKHNRQRQQQKQGVSESHHHQHNHQERRADQPHHECRRNSSERLKSRSQVNLAEVDCNRHHHHHHHRHHQHQHHHNSVHHTKSEPLLWDLPTPPAPPKKRTGLLPSFIQADPESDSSYGDASDDEMKSKQWFIIGLVIILTCGVGLGVGLPLALKRQLSLDERLDVVYKVLKEVPLIDGHNDLPWNIRQFHHNQLQTVNLSADLRSVYPWNSSNWSHTDLHRLRQGRIGAQFWAAYAPCRTQDYNAVQMTIEQIDLIKRMINLYPDHLRLAVSPEEIRQVHGNGFTASLIGIEGGHSLGNSLSVLRMMYDLGARYLTLTHNCDTPWAEADGTKDDYVSSSGSNRQRWKRSVSGLSEFGQTVIGEMNRMGMMVDLSHVSYTTIRAVLDIAKAPVIFTHSASRAVCNHSRNIPDEILRDVARNGGIVMVPFYPDFVACSRSGTMQHVIDHINHIRDIAGIDHVGIGSDFDGIDRTIQGLEDVAKYPYLLAELLADSRWTVEELKKLAGENFLRVFEKVVRVSKEMQKTGILPAEELIPLADLDEITNCTYNGT